MSSDSIGSDEECAYDDTYDSYPESDAESGGDMLDEDFASHSEMPASRRKVQLWMRLLPLLLKLLRD